MKVYLLDFDQREPVDSYRIRIPFIPVSTKNRTRVRRHGAHRVSVAKSEEAEAHQRLIATAASRLLRGQPEGETLIGGNDYAVEVLVDALRRRTDIVLHDLGPPPDRSKRWTQRDVHGILETVHDGLQGVLLDDDRQARWSSIGWGEIE